MAAGTPLATAFIEVRGDTSRLPEDIRNGVRDAARRAGSQGGGDLGNGLREGARQGTRRLGDDIRDSTSGAGEAGGREGGSRFALRFRQNVGSNMSGFGAAFTGLLPVAGIAAVGAVMGAQLVSAFTNAIDLDAATTRLAAQLDITRDQAGKYGKLAGDLYASNYGESIGAIEESIGTVIREMGAFVQSQDELSAITKSAENLSSTFDVEVSESVRAATQLIRGGLASDSAEAFDIITAGFQRIPNASEDLLDTFNEYATQFQKLGLGGDDAIGLISQAMEGGARNTDLAADALKEFSIRAVDGSTTSADAYRQIGLSAEDMTAKIAQGGEGASEGLQQVLDGLRGIEDPVKRGQAAVGLFGTQAEDLGAALYDMDLSGAASEIDSVAGAAGRMDETLGDTAQARIQGFKRSIEVGLTEAAGAALRELNDLADGIGGVVSILKDGDFTGAENLFGFEEDSEFVGFLFDARDAILTFRDEAGGALSEFGEQFGPTVEAAKEFAGTVTDAVLGVRDAVAEFYESENVGAYFQLAQDYISAVVEWLNANVVPFFAEKLPQVISFFGDVFTLLGLVIGAALDVIEGLVGVFVGTFTFIWDNFGQSILFIIQTAWDLISGVIGGALDIIQGIVRVFIALFKGDWQGLGDALAQIGRGAMDTVSSIFTGALGLLEGAFRLAVDGIKVIWEGLKEVVKAPIRFVIETVLNEGLIDGFNWIAEKVGADGLTIDHIKLPRGFSAGGYTGPGGKDQPVGIVHAGEVVFSQEDVAAWGGPAAVDQMRRAREGFASGGIVDFGRRIQREFGASVTEHPAFGGVDLGAHKGRGHREGRAIDVNTRAGTSALEQRELAPIVELAKRLGFWTLFMTSGHFNHAHIEDRGGVTTDQGILSSLLGGLSDPAKFLTDKVSGLFDQMPAAGALGDILKAVPGALVGSVVDKVKGMASDALSWFTGDEGSDTVGGDVRAQVRAVAESYGWGEGSQWSSLASLIQKESSWNPNAKNPTSSARGLFQKMTSIHGAVEPTVAGQAKWGLDYIRDRYGSPNAAWAWHLKNNWYAGGTPSAVGGLSWVGENGPELVDFRGGERVYNSQLSRRMEATALQQQAVGAPLVGSVTFQGSSGNRREELDALHHKLKLIDRGGAYRRRRGN